MQTDARAAIVLAGGRSSRLGGSPKAALRHGDRGLLSHVVSAAGTFGPVVVVAPGDLVDRALDDEARRVVREVVLEDPPFGGPVAGIAAGLAAITDAAEVVVLACDLPRAAELVDALTGAEAAEALRQGDAVCPVDAEGFRQPLAARYRVPALRDALAQLDDVRDVSMRRLTAPLAFVEVAAPEGATDDVDDPDAAARHGIELP